MIKKYRIPPILRYTKDHVWVKLVNDNVKIGVTDYAQDMSNEIVFVDLPEIGHEIKRSEVVASIESIKAISEVYSPLSGRIEEINTTLNDKPNLINKDPYDLGWIVTLTPTSLDDELSQLLTRDDYEKYLEDLQKKD